MVIPPSRDVWCTALLATATELAEATTAGAQARGFLALAELCTHRPADVTPQELFTVVAPLAVQAGAFIDRVAAADGAP